MEIISDVPKDRSKPKSRDDGLVRTMVKSTKQCFVTEEAETSQEPLRATNTFLALLQDLLQQESIWKTLLWYRKMRCTLILPKHSKECEVSKSEGNSRQSQAKYFWSLGELCGQLGTWEILKDLLGSCTGETGEVVMSPGMVFLIASSGLPLWTYTSYVWGRSGSQRRHSVQVWMKPKPEGAGEKPRHQCRRIKTKAKV